MLLVLGYPTLAEDDLAWIQSLRAAHDERYFRLVDPHFTFVFPVAGMDERPFKAHVSERVGGFRRIDFALRSALTVQDHTGEFWHLFLVPDEGFSEIVKLHDRLYTGPLAEHLRLDIPFIPHIGIGNAVDPLACKRLADELNAEGFELRGTIESLDVATYDGSNVTTLERVELA